ncbi:hypothetical protein [Geodermatophilus sp. SYSU D01119]
MHRAGVIVQTDDGEVVGMPHGLTAGQAEDPSLVVVLTHDQAAAHVADAGGRLSTAARLATEQLRAEYALGYLLPLDMAA